MKFSLFQLFVLMTLTAVALGVYVNPVLLLWALAVWVVISAIAAVASPDEPVLTFVVCLVMPPVLLMMLWFAYDPNE